MKKKTNVDTSIEYAIQKVPEQHRHLIKDKAKKLAELGNSTAEMWAKVLIEANFHNNPLTTTFLVGMFDSIIMDILEAARDKATEEQVEVILQDHPDLKGN